MAPAPLIPLAWRTSPPAKAPGGPGVLTYEPQLPLAPARRFARVDAKVAHAVVAAIKKALPDLEPKFAVRVADLLPQHADDVRALFQKSRHNLSDADVERVIAIVDENYTP